MCAADIDILNGCCPVNTLTSTERFAMTKFLLAGARLTVKYTHFKTTRACVFAYLKMRPPTMVNEKKKIRIKHEFEYKLDEHR